MARRARAVLVDGLTLDQRAQWAPGADDLADRHEARASEGQVQLHTFIGARVHALAFERAEVESRVAKFASRNVCACLVEIGCRRPLLDDLDAHRLRRIAPRAGVRREHDLGAPDRFAVPEGAAANGPADLDDRLRRAPVEPVRAERPRNGVDVALAPPEVAALQCREAHLDVVGDRVGLPPDARPVLGWTREVLETRGGRGASDRGFEPVFGARIADDERALEVVVQDRQVADDEPVGGRFAERVVGSLVEEGLRRVVRDFTRQEELPGVAGRRCATVR